MAGKQAVRAVGRLAAGGLTVARAPWDVGWRREVSVLGFRCSALGTALVVRSCSIEYHRPARLDDLLAVDTGLLDPRLDIRRASIRLLHRARNQVDGALLAEGAVKVACIEPATGRPVPLPDDVFERLRQCVPTASDADAP